MEQESSSEARLRHQLDVQTRQINRVLSRHRVPATVSGGTVRPRVVNFDLQTQIAAGLERIRGLSADLKTALGVGDVALTRQDGQWRVRVPRPDDPPVPLLRLLATQATLPPSTAAIGMAEGGRPVLARFGPGQVGHALIAGEPGSGKTSLLRAMAAGLALTNRQSHLQLQVLDPRWTSDAQPTAADTPLLPLGYLPHMLTDPAFGLDGCASLIHFLAEEMTYRRRERMVFPRIIVLMDHAVTYLESSDAAAKKDLYHLLQYGQQAGLHLVLATDRPESPLLDSTIKASMSMRVIGRIKDEAIARRVAGVPLHQAAVLYGEGDFLAVCGDDVTYFQGAHIGDYDLHHMLTELARAPRPRLLAQPYSARPRIQTPKSARHEQPRTFSADTHDGAIDLTPAVDPNPPDATAADNLPF